MKLYTSLVMFTSVIVFAEAMLQNCHMLKCPVNKTLSSSVAYTISTTQEYYEPKKPVRVIVSAKQCPKHKKQKGPEWYKLEVINSTGAPVIGRFVKPKQISEDRACEDKSLIIFHTCEPLIMHDLPRKHVWRIQEDIGQICFRITFHNKGDSYCEVIKHCIKSKRAFLMENATTTNITLENNNAYENTTILGNGTNNATAELEESSGTTPVMPMTNEPTKKPTEKRATDIIDILIGNRRRRAKRAKRCRECRKANSALDRLCGTDNVTYDSNCHLQREVCLTKKKIKVAYYGNCREHPPTKCDESRTWSRASGDNWYSGCNCLGTFKPRQCYLSTDTHKYECWCSDDHGYQISGTRKIFTCSEKLTETMNCF